MDDDIIRKAIEAAERLYTNDPNFRRFEPSLEQKIAGKNHLWQTYLDGVARVRFLACFPGQRGDWSISKSGALYLWDAREQTAGIVVLRRGAVNVAVESITAVWPRLKDAFWFDYGNGEFCWVDANFHPAANSSGSGSRYIIDPNEPY